MAEITSYSQDIIIYLQKKKGKTLRQIGDLMELSEPYIYNVKQGRKRLTLDRLKRLENALGIPIPQILLKSIGINNKDMSEEIKTQYTKLQQILISSTDLD